MPEWIRSLRWMQRRVGAHDDAMRVDRWLRHQFPHAPVSFLQRQLRQRKIRLVTADGASSTPAKPQQLLTSGAIVAIDAVVFEHGLRSTLPDEDVDSQSEMPPEVDAIVEKLLQRLMYQDANFVVLNKPHGLAVQDGTALAHSLATYLPALGAAVGSAPLRLVHRLDKDTSGLLVLARHRLAAARFAELLRDSHVHKTYDALVAPFPNVSIPENGEITIPIDAKPAHTRFRRTGDGDVAGTHWLEMQPVTGRKHQLRIHCADGLHAPIVGDRKYGSRISNRLMLHAKHLHFPDPFRPGRTIDVACAIDDVEKEKPQLR